MSPRQKSQSRFVDFLKGAAGPRYPRSILQAIKDRSRRLAPTNVVIPGEVKSKKCDHAQISRVKDAESTAACRSTNGDGERQASQANQVSDSPHAQPETHRKVTMVKAIQDAAKAKVVDSSHVRQRSKTHTLKTKSSLDHLTSDLSKEKEEKRVGKAKEEGKEINVKKRTPVHAIIQDKEKTIYQCTPVDATKRDKERPTKKSQPPASQDKQPNKKSSKAGEVHTKRHRGDNSQQPRGATQVEELREDTPNTKAVLALREQQSSDDHTRSHGSKPTADGEVQQPPADHKAQQPPDTIQEEEVMTEAHSIEAAPAMDAQPTSWQVQSASPCRIDGQGDGARFNQVEVQPDHMVASDHSLLDQISSSSHNDPSLVAVVLPGEESPTNLETLLAGVGSLSTLVADDDLTDETYIHSTVLNSSVLNFDHL